MWICLELRTFTKILCKVLSVRTIDSCVLLVLHNSLGGLRSGVQAANHNQVVFLSTYFVSKLSKYIKQVSLIATMKEVGFKLHFNKQRVKSDFRLFIFPQVFKRNKYSYTVSQISPTL